MTMNAVIAQESPSWLSGSVGDRGQPLPTTNSQHSIMKNLSSLALAGKRVLMRVDFNVPLDKETREVTDDTRIRAALPSIRYVLQQPGTSLVLMSHLGRPKGGPDEQNSLKPVLAVLSEQLGQPVRFASDCIGVDAFQLSQNLLPGEVLLLENVRFYPQEEQGDVEFARQLSRHGGVYVNDAFGTAHREHASTATIAQFFGDEKAAGFLMEAEVNNADRVMQQAQRPFTAIMGGAKVSDKILIIENLMSRVDTLVIVGAMAYTFICAMGGQTGASLCEEDKLDLARSLMQQAEAKGVKWVLPVDSVAADRFAADAATRVVPSSAIPDGWMGLDIGPQAAHEMGTIIGNSRTLLWNGPAGVFEMAPFSGGSLQLARAMADATDNGAFSLIGGGDSAAAVNSFGLTERMSYVSTGGGALLEYMEGKVLPGVAAL